MCKYIIVRPIREKGGSTAVVGGGGDLNVIFEQAENLIKELNQPLELYERISVGNPQPSVKWEGRRRPGAGA
jgi:hypothetical protein